MKFKNCCEVNFQIIKYKNEFFYCFISKLCIRWGEILFLNWYYIIWYWSPGFLKDFYRTGFESPVKNRKPRRSWFSCQPHELKNHANLFYFEEVLTISSKINQVDLSYGATGNFFHQDATKLKINENDASGPKVQKKLQQIRFLQQNKVKVSIFSVSVTYSFAL